MIVQNICVIRHGGKCGVLKKKNASLFGQKVGEGDGESTRKQAGSLKSYCTSLLRLAPTSGSRSSRTVSSCFSSVSDRLPRSSSSSRSLYSPKSFRNGSAMARAAGSHVIGLLLIAVEGRNNLLNLSFIQLHHLLLGKGKCQVHCHMFFIILSLLFSSDNSCLHQFASVEK